jgi:hypothetical protein
MLMCGFPASSLSADKEPEDAREDLLGLVPQFLGACAGQRVRNEGKWISWRPMRLCDGPAIRDEPIGADGGCWNTAQLQKDPVQHTAG